MRMKASRFYAGAYLTWLNSPQHDRKRNHPFINKFVHSTMHNLRIALVIMLTSTSIAIQAQMLPTEKVSGNKAWTDPSLSSFSGTQVIVVWFDKQFLGSGDSFLKRTQEFKGRKRSELRASVIQTLKSLSTKSFASIEQSLLSQEKSGNIKNIKQHWVINGFTCEVNEEGLKAIRGLEGVSKVFKKRPAFARSNKNYGPEYLKEVPKSRFSIAKADAYPWNIQKIRAPEVWKELGITGNRWISEFSP